jgi:HSP20 family protein
MAIAYRDPFEALQRELDHMLQTAFGSVGTAAVYPPVNLFDAGGDYVLKAELPGVAPEDVELTVEENTLTLRGERKLPELDRSAAYHRRERGEGQFRRVVRMPGGLASADCRAEFKDGVLTVRVPKAPELQPRRVSIQSE